MIDTSEIRITSVRGLLWEGHGRERTIRGFVNPRQLSRRHLFLGESSDLSRMQPRTTDAVRYAPATRCTVAPRSCGRNVSSRRAVLSPVSSRMRRDRWFGVPGHVHNRTRNGPWGGGQRHRLLFASTQTAASVRVI